MARSARTNYRSYAVQADEDRDEALDERMKRLTAKHEEQHAEGAQLEDAIRRNMKALSHGG
jgi:hypothetical protein